MHFAAGVGHFIVEPKCVSIRDLTLMIPNDPESLATPTDEMFTHGVMAYDGMMRVDV
jgi:hypothetical protein